MGNRFWTQAGAYLGGMAAGAFAGLAGMAWLAPAPPRGVRLGFEEVLFGAVAAGCLPFLFCRWIATITGATGLVGSVLVWVVSTLVAVFVVDALFGNLMGITMTSVIWMAVGGAIAGQVYLSLGGFARTPEPQGTPT
jgi:hypothetical protein